MTAAAGLAGVIYPADNPPTRAEVYAQDPALPTMKRLLAAVAAGLPALRP